MPTDTSIYNQIRQPEPLANQLTALANAGSAEARLSAEQFALGARHLDAVHQTVGALAANPNATVDDAHRALGDLVSAGMIRPDEAQRYAGQVEQMRANPAAFRNFLNGKVNELQNGRDLFHATYGTPDTQDLGDNLLTRTVSPTMGVRSIAVSPLTLKPQDKATRLPTFQNGQAGSTPTSSSVDRYGNARPAPISSPQAGGAGGATAMAPSGFTPTAPALGQTRVAEGGADQYVRDLQSAAGSASELSGLQSALGNLRNLGAEGTGPGAEGRKRVASFLNAAGLGRLPGVDPKRIEDLDEAAAYLNSAAKSGTLNAAPGQAPGAGAPTTPNLDISQPAAVNLVRAQIGLKRQQQAMARSYQGQDSGAGYANHAATFAGDQDTRAYSFDLRTPEEKQKLLQSLGPKDGAPYKKFIKSLRTAHDMGLTNAGN